MRFTGYKHRHVMLLRMSKHLAIAGFFVAVGLVAAQAGRQLEQVANAAPAAYDQPKLLTADAARVSASGETAVPRQSDGHYWADAKVNGFPVRFMVDTGATTVALPAELARQMGVIGDTVRYDQKVTTANGAVEAASVYIDTIDIGGLQIHGVEALIVEEGLDIPLLGMSYLNRLSRLEVTPDKLVLHR
jgi:aspartyl protease family protein